MTSSVVLLGLLAVIAGFVSIFFNFYPNQTSVITVAFYIRLLLLKVILDRES